MALRRVLSSCVSSWGAALKERKEDHWSTLCPGTTESVEFWNWVLAQNVLMNPRRQSCRLFSPTLQLI